jgi:hypothetical protein
MALDSTQPLRELSTRNLPGGYSGSTHTGFYCSVHMGLSNKCCKCIVVFVHAGRR